MCAGYSHGRQVQGKCIGGATTDMFVRHPGDPRRLCGESDMGWVRILTTRTRQDGLREDEYEASSKR